MVRFKVEQKVRYNYDGYIHPDGNPPKQNEIITIAKYSDYYKDSVIIKEYPFDKTGGPQCMNETCFEPIHAEFAENVCRQLIREFKTYEDNS